jgi:hypothetical protein
MLRSSIARLLLNFAYPPDKQPDAVIGHTDGLDRRHLCTGANYTGFPKYIGPFRQLASDPIPLSDNKAREPLEICAMLGFVALTTQKDTKVYWFRGPLLALALPRQHMQS